MMTGASKMGLTTGVPKLEKVASDQPNDGVESVIYVLIKLFNMSSNKII